MAKGIVFITGASSGIGEALAKEFARRGYDLGLFARRTDRLDALRAAIAKESSVRVEVAELDVAAIASVAPAIDAMREKLGGLDVIVANAGTTAINRTGGGKIDVDAHVIQVNLLGAIATLDAAARHFRKEKRGHLVGVSSVSAFMPIPGSGAYSASKAGLTGYLGAAREELRKHGIVVTAVHPGYIKTEITPDMEKYPYLITAEQGATEIVDGLVAGREDIVVPRWPWALLVPALKTLPRRLVGRFF